MSTNKWCSIFLRGFHTIIKGTAQIKQIRLGKQGQNRRFLLTNIYFYTLVIGENGGKTLGMRALNNFHPIYILHHVSIYGGSQLFLKKNGTFQRNLNS